MEAITTAMGTSLRRKLDGSAIPTESVLAACQVLGLFSAHMSQELSQTTAEHLAKLMDDLNEPNAAGSGATDCGVRFAVVVLPQDVAPSESAVLEGQHGAYVMDCDKRALTASEASFRKHLQLSMAVRLPELLLIDVSTGSLMSTDAATRVCNGDLRADAFPAGWCTNVFRAAPPVSIAGVTARLSEKTMLRLGLYPGDPISVRSLATGESVYLQAGGHDDVAEEDVAALHAAGGGLGEAPCLLAPDDSSVLLPAAVMAVLGAREASSVAVDRAAEPEEGVAVTVVPVEAAVDASDIDRKPDAAAAETSATSSERDASSAPTLPRGAAAFFGLPRADAAGSVSAAIATMLTEAPAASVATPAASAASAAPCHDDDDDAAESRSAMAAAQLGALIGDSGSVPEWLLEHVRNSDCKHRLVGAGQTIAVRVGAGPTAAAAASKASSPVSTVASLAASAGPASARARALSAVLADSYSVFRVASVGKGEYVTRVGPSTAVTRA